MGIFRKWRHQGNNSRDERGQSTVEYLIITFMVVAALVYPTNIYETIGGTLKNKYQSYCFGVAISDPPRKEFDEKVKKGAEMAHKVIDTIKDMKNAAEDVKHFHLPTKEVLPSFSDIDIERIIASELETYSHQAKR